MSFFKQIKRLASETAIYGLSTIVGRMVNFLLFPLYSHVFPIDHYGNVSVIYAAFIFLNIFYQYGMESAYLKFASRSKDPAQKRIVFSTTFWSLLGTSVLISALVLLFRRPMGMLIGLESNWLWLLSYAAFILAIDTLTAPPFAELRLENKAWRFATIKFINVLVNVAMNLILILWLRMGIEAVLIANLIASFSTLLLLIPTYLKNVRFAFDRKRWVELLRFGLPFVPGGLGYAVAERVNIFYLANLSPERVKTLYGSQIDLQRLAAQAEQAARQAGSAGGASQAAEAAGAVYGQYVVGVFNGVLKLAILMALVVQMFRFAWQPFFLQHADDEDAPLLFARIFTVFTAFCLIVYLAISFFAHELVAFPLPGGRYLVSEGYWMGLFIVPVSLLGYVFQGWYYTFSAGAYIKEKTKYFVHCTLAGSAVALALNMLFVPRYGMAAAAWATTAAYAVMALMLLVIVQKFYPVPYEWKRIVSMGLLAAALFLVWDFIPVLQKWWTELGLLLVFIAGLVLLRIVPPALIRSLPRRIRTGAGRLFSSTRS